MKIWKLHRALSLALTGVLLNPASLIDAHRTSCALPRTGMACISFQEQALSSSSEWFIRFLLQAKMSLKASMAHGAWRPAFAGLSGHNPFGLIFSEDTHDPQGSSRTRFSQQEMSLLRDDLLANPDLKPVSERIRNARPDQLARLLEGISPVFSEERRSGAAEIFCDSIHIDLRFAGPVSTVVMMRRRILDEQRFGPGKSGDLGLDPEQEAASATIPPWVTTPGVQEAVRRALGFTRAGQLDQAASILSQALRQVAMAAHERIHLQSMLAEIWVTLHQPDNAIPLLRELTAIPDLTNRGVLFFQLGEAYGLRGALQEDIQDFNRAVEALVQARALLGSNDELLPQIDGFLGQAYMRIGRYEEAYAALMNAINAGLRTPILYAAAGSAIVHVASTRGLQGTDEAIQQQISRALGLFAVAMQMPMAPALRQATVRDLTSFGASIHIALGVPGGLGQFIARLFDGLQALGIRTGPLDWAEMHTVLGKRYERLGRIDLARQAFQEALRSVSGHPGAIAGLSRLASAS